MCSHGARCRLALPPLRDSCEEGRLRLSRGTARIRQQPTQRHVPEWQRCQVTSVETYSENCDNTQPPLFCSRQPREC